MPDLDYRQKAWSAGLIVLFFVAWELFCLMTGMSDLVLPRPSQVFVTLFQKFPLLWPHILQTLATTMIGFVLGAALMGLGQDDAAEQALATAAALEAAHALLAPLLAPGGALLAMKGSGAVDELSAATETMDACGLSIEAPLEVTMGASVTYVVRASLIVPDRAAAVLGKADSNARDGKRRRGK